MENLSSSPWGALNPEVPDGIFDEDYYLRTYTDVLNYEGSPWEHFIFCGDREGRSPNAELDINFYKRCYMPLESTYAGHHYILRGRPLGYHTRPRQIPAGLTGEKVLKDFHTRPCPLLVLGNDVHKAGAPLLLLELLSALKLLGYQPLVVLRNGGELYEQYRAKYPTYICEEGWDVQEILEALPPKTPVIANTCWGVQLLSEGPESAREFSLALIHEMPDYVRQNSLMPALQQMPHLVFATEAVRLSYQHELEPTSKSSVVVPSIKEHSVSNKEANRLRLELARHRTLGDIYISAGYGDRRKGFDLFIEVAWKILAREPKSVFIWLGELSAWALEIAQEARQQGLPLITPGYVANSHTWYAISSAYLLTSRQDPGPTTAIDALGQGLAMVAYRSDLGILDIFSAETAWVGQLVEPYDSDSMAEQALELVMSDTPEKQGRRKEFVATIGSSKRYAHELLDLLPAGAHKPSVLRSQLGERLAWLRPLKHLLQVQILGTCKQAIQSTPVYSKAYSALGPIYHWGFAQVAVNPLDPAQGSEPRTTDSAAEVMAIKPCQRSWVQSLDSLRFMTTPFIAHLVRYPGDEIKVLRAIEDLALSSPLAEIRQYDSKKLPGWVAKRKSPPLAPCRSRQKASVQYVDPNALASEKPLSRLPRIAVFIHMFYLESCPVIKKYLEHVPQPYDLYISTNTLAKLQAIEGWFPDARVKIAENRGRDIMPKFVVFAQEHQDYDLVLHLHSKKSPHSADLDDWLVFILDSLLPSRQAVEQIIGALASDRVGMVAPFPHPSVVNSWNWSTNYPIAQALTWKNNWGQLPKNKDFMFPAGSMFWARVDALQPIFSLGLTAEHFPVEEGQKDSTVAHALERLLAISCSKAGHKFTMVNQHSWPQQS
ncbi:rhamnan synthesis F family protein [Rothia sp. P4278]|uniref:rhamnan synthesis F family protein n=1 Tax=Rothia sp. P4278 TaxID=3402658 RepID=UPI003AD938B0